MKRRTFTVVEYAAHYAVRHNPTGKEQCMGDGVDTLFAWGKAMIPGSEHFRRTWEDSLNAEELDTLEAYFPEEYEKEM